MANINEFFFMRNGFNTFRLEPGKHNYLLFGSRDREQRDHLLDHLEEASYSLEGYKSVVLGDYGRGKTHQSRNIEYEIKSRGLNLSPIYLKCIEFKTKETFSTFFKELILSIPTEDIKGMAQEYEERTMKDDLPALETIIEDEDVARVFREGLTAPSLDTVRLCMRWLGGEQKLNMENVASSLPTLTVSKQFGAVMKGIVQLFREIKGKTPVYLIDEAERLALVSQADAYWSWLAALRELTDIVGVALIFFIGAKSRDELPAMILQDEVMTRIGVCNYVEFYNQGRDDLRDFLTELFQTIIRKGPILNEQKQVLVQKFGKEINGTVPDELKAITENNEKLLRTYPFTIDALEGLIEHCTTSELSNKPREVLILVQKAVTRAMRNGNRLIDSSILEGITKDGL